MINHKIEEVAIVAKIMIIVMNYWWLWWLLHTQWTCQSGHNSLDCSAWNILHDENLQKMKLMMNFSMTRWWISRCLPRPSWCMGTLRGSRGKPPRLVVVILLRKNLTTRYILSLPVAKSRFSLKISRGIENWRETIVFFACSQWIMRPITIVISTTPKSPNFPRSVETVH